MGSLRQILLVDDDPGQLRVRDLLLRSAGFSSLTAASAEDALQVMAVEGAKIEAVVTDHLLPGMDGAGLVRKLRERWPRLPVVVLTGLSGVEELYAGLNVAVLLKPCRPEELIAELDRMTKNDPAAAG